MGACVCLHEHVYYGYACVYSCLSKCFVCVHFDRKCVCVYVYICDCMCVCVYVCE